MKPKSGTNRPFVIAFVVLTIFLWCPLGYGPYGQVGRILGIPSWAVWAYILAAVLFVLECIYLFRTGLAVDDAELAEIVSQLSALDSDQAASEKEGE